MEVLRDLFRALWHEPDATRWLEALRLSLNGETLELLEPYVAQSASGHAVLGVKTQKRGSQCGACLASWLAEMLAGPWSAREAG